MRLPDAGLTARRASRAILLAFGSMALLFSGVFPPFSNPNELSRFQTVVAFCEQGTFAIDSVIAPLGDHEDKATWAGRTYSNKAPGLSFAAIPVYWVLRLAFPPPTSGTADAIFWVMRLLTVSLVCLIGLARFMRRVAMRAAAAAPLITCAVAFGTPYLYYSRSFFAHAWTAALLFLSWDLLRMAGRPPARKSGGTLFAAGFLAGWAAISEYTVGPVALLLAIRSAADRSWKSLGAFLLGAAVPVALLGLYDTICFGSPWVLSSSREAYPSYSRLAETGLFGFGPPSPSIAAAYLFHPARGVILFSPFLLWCGPGFLRWWRSREERSDCLLATAATVLFFVVMTGYPNWHGGWSLGSRYLLPILFLPAVAIGYAVATPLSRGLFAAATVFSVAGHFLLSFSWPHFPDNVPWPVSSGSRWFLLRGWIAPSLFGKVPWGGAAAFLLAGLAIGLSVTLAVRAAGPISPRPASVALIGLAPLAFLLLRPPELEFPARLWRAAIFGAYSGRDPERTELNRVALSAATPLERRQAVGAWRMYGPPPRR